MKSLLATIIIGCAIFSCGAESEQDKQREIIQRDHWNTYALKSLRYYHDEHTELCFAVYCAGSNTGMMTLVPCSAAVMERAQNFKSDK